MANANTEPLRPVSATRDKQGRLCAASITSPENFPVRAKICEWPEVVIPIVFLPGIMGSNLKVRDKNDSAWRIPNGAVDGIPALLKYWRRDAAKRQQILDPNNTEVDRSGPAAVPADIVHYLVGEGKTPQDVARWRGWGAVHRASYGKLFADVEQKLAEIFRDGEALTEYWQQEITDAAKYQNWGARRDFDPLTEDQLKKVAEAAYPVHAAGYNWLKSNRDSAQQVMLEVDKIIAYYREQKFQCDQVILLTHSMGGLVGRACASLVGGEPKILGVVHAVMPAIGAPSTYKRMRAGFEGVEQVILGRDAAETTCVLAHAPGGLELLPTEEYYAKIKRRQHWLRATAQTKNAGSTQPADADTLLGEGNPYDTIYLNNKDWWRLVKEELIDPAGKDKKKLGAGGSRDAQGVFGIYADNLEIARTFHSDIKHQYHPVTYAFYGADKHQATWNEVQWRTSAETTGVSQGEMVDDDLNGTLHVKAGEKTVRLDMQERRAPGDGTVPEESGEAAYDYCTQIFKHEGEEKQQPSYDHQFCFDNAMTLGVTLYSIAKIAATSPLLDES